MKLVIIADTHGETPEVPDGDVLIHCGDISSRGDLAELEGFNQWFSSLPHKYKILVAGNHDWCFENAIPVVSRILDKSIIYLEDSGVEIEGLKFWGTPIQPEFCNWAFNRPKGIRRKHYKQIPNDTDILITHCPPYGACDRYLGCTELLKAVKRVQPTLHCFGHIHGGSGWLPNLLGLKTLFCNASVLDENYDLAYPAKEYEIKVVTI